LNQIVAITGLTKYYGRIKALDNLTLSIPENSVFGILGPNGSGKTTTLGILLNVTRPTSGTYKWFDREPDEKCLQQVGSILESPAFYPYLSAVDNLRIIAEIKKGGFHNIDKVCKLTGIYDRRHTAFRTYSLGMKQRLALAAALLTDPKVLILDEPTNGMDPSGIAEIRDIIRNIASQGKTIILASHLLDEVQKVCSHFAILKKGQLIYTGMVEPAENEQHFEMASDNFTELLEILKRCPQKPILNQKDGMVHITLPAKVTISEISRYVFEQGATITHLVALKKSLENQFLEIINEKA
jgi:ABC-2 type transport system ATP-binding protein